MLGKGLGYVLPSLALGGMLLFATPSPAEDEPPSWLETAAAAGEVDEAEYRQRIAEIVADVNATREQFAGVGPVAWDMEKSEGHYRHARWLLHHMKEPWNSGGVEDFYDEPKDSELFHAEGRSAAKVSQVAIKYLKRGKPFQPCDRWLPAVAKRFPWLVRSAKTVYVGCAEGVVPKGAEFAGELWGVVVLSTDADYARSRAREDVANRDPVICPMDGATDVPLELLREDPDIVPAVLDGPKGKKLDLGFPLTFSFFGGQAILSGAQVTLVRLEDVEVVEEDEKPKRRPPGKRRPKKKPPKKKPKYETVEKPAECYVSTPMERSLRDRPGVNVNSVVAIPHKPLVAGATYRATLTCSVGDGRGGQAQAIELVTTFTTVATTPKKQVPKKK